jgi:small neutral amino acid transporter SnatA (MarC family)
MRSPRFGILLCAICLAIVFTGLDIAASIHDFIGSTDGVSLRSRFIGLSLIVV